MIVIARARTGTRTNAISFDKQTGEYLISVTARPTEGEANKAIILLISKELGVPKTLVSLESGEKSRIKRFKIDI